MSNPKKWNVRVEKKGLYEKNLELYTDKLFQGDLSRYGKKFKKDNKYSIDTFYRDKGMIERKTISKSTEKVVLDKYNDRCDICEKPYDEYDFEIHRIDGDRSNLMATNLVSLCCSCHKKIEILVKLKLRNHKVEQEGKKPKEKYGLPEIEPINIKMSKPPKGRF